MVFPEMCQNSRHCLIPIPRTESDPLKQAPPPPVDVFVPVLGNTAGYCTAALFGFPFLEIMSEDKKGGYSAAHPVSYYASKQIFSYRGFVLH